MFGSDASFPKSQQSGKTQVSVTARKKKKRESRSRVKLFSIRKATPRGMQVIYKPNQMCSKEAVCVF